MTSVGLSDVEVERARVEHGHLHTAELSGGWLALLLLAAIPGAVVGLLRRRNG